MTNTHSRWYAMSELLPVLLQGLVCALLVRCFLFQPFSIPSGSMEPTLLIGDYLFVSKYAYGYSRYSFPLGYDFFSGRVWSSAPERGDVVVFRSPHHGQDIDYVKRLIGLPGDRVRMSEGTLHINDQEVPKEIMETSQTDLEGAFVTRYRETLPNGRSYIVLDLVMHNSTPYTDNTQEYEVPPGHYFVMGDNRDRSLDSRVPDWDGGIGFVPAENLIGRAEIIFFSKDAKEGFWGVPSWLEYFRWERISRLIR